MSGKIAAVIAAAIGAGFVVGAVPGFAPDVTANASAQHDSVAADANNVALWPVPAASGIQVAISFNLGSPDHKSCAESWPYYETSCLHDERQADRGARIVRIIAVDRPKSDRRE